MTVTTQIEKLEIEYDPLKCSRCGMCLEVCGFQVWELPEEGSAILARPENCTNCTACAKNCLGEAIVVRNLGCGCVWNEAARRLGLFKESIVGPEKSESTSCCDVKDTKSSCCG